MFKLIFALICMFILLIAYSSYTLNSEEIIIEKEIKTECTKTHNSNVNKYLSSIGQC